VDGADFPPVLLGDPITPTREKLIAFRKQLADLDSWLGAEISAPQPYSHSAMALISRPLGEGNAPSEFHPVKPWPLSDPAAARCSVLTGEVMAQAAKLASQTSAFATWVHDSQHYFLEFRPLLPDEKDCQNLTI
jgi:hypothetical protein